jgi:phosphatidylglycerol lysyltransferase
MQQRLRTSGLSSGPVRAALSIGALILVTVALEKSLRGLTWAHLRADIHALSWGQLAASVAATLASYALLTIFDWQGLRAVGRKVSQLRMIGTAFMANALGHSLGFASLTGGAIRLKGYGDSGCTAGEVGQIVFHTTTGFLIGAWALAALTAALVPQQLAAVLWGGIGLWRTLGLAALAALLAMLLVLRATPFPVRWRKFRLTLPSRRDASLALAVSIVELGCAAAALYVLLPDAADVSFGNFIGLYLIAVLVGLISTVPAGLGVFEWTLLRFLPQVNTSELLASILVYRIIYYVLPLVIGIVAPAAVMFRNRGRTIGRLLGEMTPALAAVAVFGAGAWLLLAGSLPLPREARGDTPLALLEISHLTASLLGVALLVLARGIQQRNHGAWVLTFGALSIAAVLSTLRRDPPLLTAAVIVLALALWIGRRRFYRPASLFEARFSWIWWRNVIIVIFGTAWLMLFAYRHVPYQHELLWQFEAAGDAPRALRALVVVVVVLSAIALRQLLRPARGVEGMPDSATLDALKPVLDSVTETQPLLAYLGDKAILSTTDKHGFIMYQSIGHSLIAMGDPVGDPASRNQLRWAFRELADRRGLNCVFYQIGSQDLERYLDLGLSLAKLGEEAIVDLNTFTLEGGARAKLRGARNRALREGLSFVVVPPEEVDARLDELKQISDEWLQDKIGAEKGFSLGFFAPGYLRRFPCALVLRGGQPVAFANLWLAPAGHELSVDLMRQTRDAPAGVMDFLLIETMLWGKAHAFRAFNLGMAPLSGMARHRLASRWQRLLDLIARRGQRFYNFEGLRRYKAKFGPQWRPRYLAAPGGLALPGILLDVTRLIGGVRTTPARDDEAVPQPPALEVGATRGPGEPHPGGTGAARRARLRRVVP